MKLVEFELLQPRKTGYILFNLLIKKYSSAEYNRFSEQDFKSILALSFAIELHLDSISNSSAPDRKVFISDTNPYFKISIDFGLTLLDNLNDFEKERFDNLLSQPYKFEGIFRNPDIKEFTHETLIDQMNVRRWEYGKYFLESFTQIMDKTLLNQSFKALQGQENFWDIMYQKMDKIKEPLENYEAVLLAYFIKNHIEKQDLNMRDYFLLGSIACQKMTFVFKREQNLKQAVKEIISLDQNLKKKKGRRI
jgi:hypothetical protein